jgi:hypothetical protein
MLTIDNMHQDMWLQSFLKHDLGKLGFVALRGIGLLNKIVLHENTLSILNLLDNSIDYGTL